MKKNILLPIFSAASITTIVTPLMSACGSSYKTYTYDLSHIQTWVPSIKQKEPKAIDPELITSVYLSDINNNKKIWAEDWINFWGPIHAQNYDKKASLTIKKINLEKLSMSVKIGLYGTGMKTLCELKNIPIDVKFFDDDPQGWGVTTKVDFEGKWLLNNPGWSYYEKTTFFGDEPQPPQIQDYNYEKLQEIDEPQKSQIAEELGMEIYAWTSFSSYYLEKIPQPNRSFN